MSDQELKGSKQNLNKHKLPILAIDFGQKRVGIAISDSLGIVGSPLSTIKNTRKRGQNGVIQDILKLAQEERIGSIMVGMPQEFEKSYRKSIDKINKFGEKLSSETELEVWYYDESFSSNTALNTLPISEAKARRAGSIDKMSAAIFLQEYLDATSKT